NQASTEGIPELARADDCPPRSPPMRWAPTTTSARVDVPFAHRWAACTVVPPEALARLPQGHADRWTVHDSRPPANIRRSRAARQGGQRGDTIAHRARHGEDADPLFHRRDGREAERGGRDRGA